MNGDELPFWRTPQAGNATQGPKSRVFYEQCKKTGQSAITLTDQVKFFPTPTVTGNNNRRGASAKSGDGLATAIKRMFPTPMASDAKLGHGLAWYARKGNTGMFPTPTASLATHGGPNQRDSSGRPGLQMAAMLFPTPTASQRGDCPAERARRTPCLETAAKMYATPQARDYRTGQAERWNDPNRSRNLNDQIGGQLNPDWVEWLMGFPRGWTDKDGPKGLPGKIDNTWDTEPADIPRLARSVPDRIPRLKAYGNAVVPQQAYPIFAAISQVVRQNQTTGKGRANE